MSIAGYFARCYKAAENWLCSAKTLCFLRSKTPILTHNKAVPGLKSLKIGFALQFHLGPAISSTCDSAAPASSPVAEPNPERLNSSRARKLPARTSTDMQTRFMRLLQSCCARSPRCRHPQPFCRCANGPCVGIAPRCRSGGVDFFGCPRTLTQRLVRV
jgi:hypothetical protein